ncbi:MAG: hypothetical protein Q8O56_15150 [Solirubrobacteraceae bacterium]|nr:hypothetical protein [Solirubrobacteraceae bacterium]
MTDVLRELDRCVFCDAIGVTEEHLIADWAYRAFVRKRRLHDELFLRGRFVGPGQLQMHSESEAIPTAKVVCGPCNNGWMSGIDQAASRVLRPLIRGEREAVLDPDGQAAAAAWIFKSALILDVADHGIGGPLASLRPAFAESRMAPPGCVIYAGPAGAPPSLTVGDPPTTVNLWMLGVRPANGRMRVTGSVRHPDGTITSGVPRDIPIPGYQVMVGAFWAYVGGHLPPVTPESLVGFEQVWPVQEVPVTFRAASLRTAKDGMS